MTGNGDDPQAEDEPRGRTVEIPKYPGGNIGGRGAGFKVTGRDPQPGDGKRGRGRDS